VINFQALAGSPSISSTTPLAPGAVTTFLPNALVPHPNGIVFDPAGHLFVLGGFQCNLLGNHTPTDYCGATTHAYLYQLDPTTGAILKQSTNFDVTDTLDGLAYDPKTGDLFATSEGGGVIYRINIAAFLASANLTYAPPVWASGLPAAITNTNEVFGPDGIMSDGKGNLFVADRDSGNSTNMFVYQCSSTTAATGSCTQTNQIFGVDDLTQLSVNPPVITRSFNPNPILAGAGNDTVLTITVTNPNNNVSLFNVTFNDTLPVGPPAVTVAATPGLATTCPGGTAIISGATAGSGTISMPAPGITLNPSASCTVTVHVTAPVAGNYPNTVTVTSSNGGPGTPGTSTLVVQAVSTLVFQKTVSPSQIAVGGTAVVTFSISNPNLIAVTGVTLTDPLPPGTVVAPTIGLNNTCGGTFVPPLVSGATNFNLTGVSLAASGSPGSSCSVSFNMTVTGTGSVNNCANLTTTTPGIPPPAQSCVPLLLVGPPSIGKTFVPATINLNGTSVLTLTITNPPTNAATLIGITVTDPLPAGISVAATPNLVNNCAPGTVSGAIAGSTSLTLTGGTLAVGASCTISFNVTGTTPGSKTNITTTVTSSNGGPGNQGTAVLNVIAPPLILKAFTPASVGIGGGSTVTFTVTNPNSVTLTGIGFSDTFPAGMIAANPPNVVNTCTGTLTPIAAGGTTFTLTGATLAAGASCSITVSVGTTTTTPGQLCNTTTVITSIEGGPGGTATACLFVQPAPDDVYQIRYAANLNIGDSFVNFTNAGTLSGTDPSGRICVNVYAFDPAEEIISCCSCLVTPNGLTSLSVNRDIMGNTLTPGRPTSIVIKLLASTPVGGTCNASAPTSATLVRGMRAWGTTLHAMPAGAPSTYAIAETPFARAELSPSELAKLTSYCGFIQTVGSGFGQCASCPTSGAQGGASLK